MASDSAALVCAQDFEDRAKQVLSKDAFEFFASGAEEEQTLKDNKKAFSRIRLLPRMLRDVSNRDLSTTILGQRVAFPIAVAPSAKHCMAHPDGEVATAQGAASVGAGMILSSWSTKSLEDVAAATSDGIRWFQIGIFRDREMMKNLIQRAEKAGYKGLFVTIDSVILGKGYTYMRKLAQRGAVKNPQRFENFAPYGFSDDELYTDATFFKIKEPALSWDIIDWIKSITSLPIVLKGILTVGDALEAVAHKVDGIVVSNHGGGLLDGVPATIDVLADIVAAVRDSGIEVYLDGGIRKGTDALKAIALGARAVFIGRPAIWGLACDGEAGVRRVLETLRDEFDIAMALSGCKNVTQITPDILDTRRVTLSGV